MEVNKIMTLNEVYEKYKHLDKNLSDRDMLHDSFWGDIIWDLWAAIKSSREDNKK